MVSNISPVILSNPISPPNLAVANDLLDLRVHSAHLLIQLWVIAPHDRGVPASSDKDGFDTAGDGCGEDVCDLEADEE